MKLGTIYGLGVGPGAPDLMTLRACQLLNKVKYIAFFRKAGHMGRAREIVNSFIQTNVIELPMEYPVTTEIPITDTRYDALMTAFYQECKAQLKTLSEKGVDVAVLCEGDPFFYGSFIHLYLRLKSEVPIEVVPAVTGMSAAWTATEHPITWGSDVMSVLVGTMNEENLVQHMVRCDALVIMKVGRNLKKIVSALKTADRHKSAWLIEYASMAEQRTRHIDKVEDQVAPYFSIIVVHGQGRRH
ncbi:MAG: precorrin-2 C(20)-methyltransferase [Aestuariivita sp.]|nr:precorrin-2 C(20)-methyltransferase [Aestuariivita sp.]